MRYLKTLLGACLGVSLSALPAVPAHAYYPGPWGPCAGVTGPDVADPWFGPNPFGPSPGRVRDCERRMWKYGPPPWAVAPPPVLTPVLTPVVVIRPKK
jgi:hypothetical protein